MRAFAAALRHPGAVGMSAAAFVGRFPMAMLGLALTLLVVSETGSYAFAGAVAGAMTLASAVGGPVGAGLADRHGQHRVLPPLIALHTVAVTALTMAVLAGTSVALWLGLATLAGLTGPNLGAMVRARWAGVAADARELGSAFALESTLDEVAFVLGPPLTTALAVAVAPWSAVAAGLLLAVSGTTALALQRRTEPQPTPRGSTREPRLLHSGPLRILSLLMLLMGAVFGALEVGTVAFAEEAGSVPATGWLLGLFALSSGLTGLYLGSRPGAWQLRNQLLVGTGALTATAAVLPLIDGVATFGAAMFAAGFGVSAVLIGSLQLIERAVPRSRLTQSLALAISGIQVGFALAAALTGQLIDAGGAHQGLAVGSVSAAGGLLLVVVSRPALRRAEAGTDPTRAATRSSAHRPTEDPQGAA